MIDFVKLLKDYKPGWVGISSDFERVLVWGATLHEAMDKARKVPEKIFYFPVEKSYGSFIG